MRSLFFRLFRVPRLALFVPVLMLELTLLQSAAVRAQEQDMLVGLEFGGQRIVVRLDDNPAARNFFASLPLELAFEDYNSTEKIATLPDRLDTTGAPASCDPEVGSFTYYQPWNNLAIFYRDFRFSRGLVPLGTITAGLEHLTAIRDGTRVRLTRLAND